MNVKKRFITNKSILIVSQLLVLVFFSSFPGFVFARDSQRDFKNVSEAKNKFTGLSLSKSILLTSPGHNESVTLTALNANGTAEDVTKKAKWASDSDSIQVNQGQIKVLAPGQATISASYLSKVAVLTVNAAVKSVSLDRDALDLDPGLAAALKLTAIFADGNKQDVTQTASWNSNTGNISVARGQVKAQSAGTAWITAEYGGKQAKAKVNANLKSIRADQSRVFLSPGASRKVSITAVYSNGISKDITEEAQWFSDNSAIRVEKGTVTSDKFAKGTIFAKYGGKTAAISVDASVKDLKLSDTKLTMKPGGTANIKFTATYADGKRVDITEQAVWRSSNPQVTAAAGKIQALDYGKALITAAFGGKTVHASVDASLKGVKIESEKLMLRPGEHSIVKLIARNADKTTSDVTHLAQWSAGSSIIQVSQGLVTALETGKSAVKAVYKGKEAKLPVIVAGGAQKSRISLSVLNDPSDATRITLPLGTRAQTVTTAAYGDTTVDVSGRTVYTSSNPQTATISAAGLIETLKTGNTVITAVYNKQKAKLQLTVTPPAITRLDMDLPEHMETGEQFPLQVTAVYSDDRQTDITNQSAYSSANTAVAAVDKQGMVTAVSEGKTVIQASYNGIVEARELTVSQPKAEAIALDASVYDLNVGETQLLKVTAQFANGQERDISLEAGYTIGNPEIAGVSQGVLTAKKAGETTITAAYQGLSIQAAIKIVDPYDLDNKGFETYSSSRGVADSWGIFNTINIADGTPEFEVAAAPVFAGSRAQKITAAGLTWSQMTGISQVIPVKAGQPFSVDAQVKASGLNDAKALLYVDFSNEANQFSGNVSSEYTADTGGYIPLSASGVTPADATRAWVYVLLKGTGDNKGSGDLYVDEVNVRYENDTAPPVVTLTAPPSGAAEPEVTTTLQLYFNEEINAGFAYNRISLQSGTSAVPVSVTIAGNALTVVPAQRLDRGTSYTLTLPEGALQDKAGNPAAAYTANFKTTANLLDNKGFETYSSSRGAADSWGVFNSTDGTPELEVVATPAFTGSRAQKITAAGLTWSQMAGVWQVIPVKAGQPFTVDAQVQASGLHEAKALLYVDFSNDANQFSGNVSAEYTSDTDGYIPLNASGITPADATRAWVYVLLKGTGDNRGSGAVYVDDVNFKYVN